MNLVTLLLMGYSAFVADRDRLPLSDEEKGPVETLTDLALLAKGRILVCFVKEGMTVQQVVRILGHPNMVCGDFCGSLDHWFEYGIWVDFTIVDREKYDSRV